MQNKHNDITSKSKHPFVSPIMIVSLLVPQCRIHKNVEDSLQPYLPSIML